MRGLRLLRAVALVTPAAILCGALLFAGAVNIGFGVRDDGSRDADDVVSVAVGVADCAAALLIVPSLLRGVRT